MQALRWHAARDVRLEEVAEPAAPPPGFAVIDVAYCGICGSDLAEPDPDKAPSLDQEAAAGHARP